MKNPTKSSNAGIGFGAARLARCSLLIGLLLSPLAHAVDAARPSGIDEQGDAVLGTLERKDFESLARHVCPGSRLGFSPYTRNLSKLFVARFAPKTVARFGDGTRKYLWGRYDGSGRKILLTPIDYHASFIYDVDYRSLASRMHLSSAAVKSDPELKAIAIAYPGADVVLYRSPGTEALGHKDARELFLIFGVADRRWCLRGISHGEDTI